MNTIRDAARTVLMQGGINPGEQDSAVGARALLDRNNNVVLTGEDFKGAGRDGRPGIGVWIPFVATGTISKAVKATGSVVLSGVPSDGDTVTISDGTHTASVFEFDSGTAATGTLTFTGQPSDTQTVTLGDGTTSKVFEFDTGVTGVASTGGIITISTGAPSDGDTVTLTTSTPAGSTASVFEFNNSGGVTGGRIAVLTGSSAATAATELIAAINGTGGYAGNGSTGYTASSGGSGVVNLVRTATGAGNETITKSGANIAVTASFSGGVTAIAAGLAITGGRVGVAIGVDTATTQANLLAAINAVSGPAFLFTATQGAGTTITLTANTRGTAGNSFTMSETAGNFTVSGANFTGGAAAGSGAVTGSNIAVAIGATLALSATALHTAINAAASLDVTSTNSPAGTCALSADTAGTTFNVAITKSGANITVTGMIGGTNAPTVTLVNALDVPGATGPIAARALWVESLDLLVGATAWTAAGLSLAGTDGTVFATVTQASLGIAAELHVGKTGVAIGAGWFTGGAAGAGLVLTASGVESVGADVAVRVSGWMH